MNKTLLFCFCLLVMSPAFSQSKTKAAPAPKPFVLGLIDELHSDILAENRVLNIYLPPGYKAEDTVTYPVVYLLDGSADEDFIHVVGLYQFNNFDWIDRVPKSIIVGIATVNRRRDLTFPSTVEAEKTHYPESGHSDKFINFLEKELQPYIARKYKTRASRTIIGQSLGGLLATEILFTRPSLFDKYIIISPSLWWNNGSLLNTSMAMDSAINRKTDIYIGVGKEGVAPGNPPRVMTVDANLLADKLMSIKNSKLTVHFDYLPQEDHATVAHQAIFNALRMLYAEKKWE